MAKKKKPERFYIVRSQYGDVMSVPGTYGEIKSVEIIDKKTILRRVFVAHFAYHDSSKFVVSDFLTGYSVSLPDGYSTVKEAWACARKRIKANKKEFEESGSVTSLFPLNSPESQELLSKISSAYARKGCVIYSSDGKSNP